MPRERKGYRDQLESILERYPDRECLTPQEVADYCGRDVRTVTRLFPFVGQGRTRFITRTALARELVAG